MGRRDKKNAKGRLDHFYWLAKEQGYRSRAAFKLVQLNKKYNFLEHARCCIDLCAAPGGWLQVASKYMPANSLIVGVDLVPIKPIPRCITFAEDINSYKCRDQLRNELKDWKADVVLHDGAPNVGTAWVQDAYTQSELTLQSLKLAVEFLAPGGTFVTKVFRSKDYNSLLWVFNQLFKTVEATKPASSRNVSAEIFVVCVGFKAPARIDPKFLDPQHVFKDLEPGKFASISGEEDGSSAAKEVLEADKIVAAAGAHAQANVFQPEKKRRKRDGYMEGDYTLFKSASLHDFLRTHDPVSILGVFNEIALKLSKNAPAQEKEELEKALKHEETTEDIRINCADLRVLGKKDFRRLLKWRLALRSELDLEKVADTVEITEHEEPEEELDEEAQIDEELVRLNEESARRARKERRRKNEAKAKTIQKLQLSMTTPMDIGAELADEALGGEEEFFGLNHVDDEGRFSKRHGRTLRPDADKLIDVDGEERVQMHGSDDGHDDDDDEEDLAELNSDEEREARLLALEGDVDDMYERYRNHLQERDAKFRAREARKKLEHREKWEGIKENAEDSDDGADLVRKIKGAREAAQDGDEEENDSEGGYDIVERRKLVEETYDSEDAEDDEDEEEDRRARRAAAAPGKSILKKRKRVDDEAESKLAQAKAANGRAKASKGAQSAAVDAQQSREAAIWFDNPLFKAIPGLEEDQDVEEDAEETGDVEDDDDSEAGTEEDDEEGSEEDDEEDEDAESGDDDDIEIVPQDDGAFGHRDWDFDDEDIDEKKREYIKKHGLTTAEAVSLAQSLVNRQTTKSALIDSGFAKHNFVDKDGLPTWFLDDEGKHYKANVPITKEAVDALRAKQRALDARPIKKIAEAKARKKFKAAQRLAKAQAKAENMAETEDISEREKAQNISKVLAKGQKKPQKKEVKLIVAKGTNRGLKGRPKGVKGRYRMVDPRMKKEIRAQKRIDKRDGKKRSSSHTQKKPRIPNGYTR